MNQPTVSIVIPSFNHSRFIAECVRSACLQSYKKTKVYVVDDGSTDNTIPILNELKKQHPFEVFQLAHQGLVPTLNWAIEHIELGDYVTFLGSDDIIPPERMALQVECLQKNPDAALAYGNYTEITEDGREITLVRCLHPEKNFFAELLLSNFIAAPTTLIRTSILRKVGGFDNNFKIEDWALWLKISKNYPVVFLDENLAFYRMHNLNQHKKIEVVHRESLNLLEAYRDERNFCAAVSLVNSKFIAKSFLISFRLGLLRLRKHFRFLNLWHVVVCFIQGRGPFRKFRVRYLFQKHIFVNAVPLKKL